MVPNTKNLLSVVVGMEIIIMSAIKLGKRVVDGLTNAHRKDEGLLRSRPERVRGSGDRQRLQVLDSGISPEWRGAERRDKTDVAWQRLDTDAGRGS